MSGLIGGYYSSVTVYEKGLGDASDDSESAGGVIRITAPSGLDSIVVDGQTISLADLQALGTAPRSITIDGHGTLILTGLTSTGTIEGKDAFWDLSYTYTLTNQQTHTVQGIDEFLSAIDLKVVAGNPVGSAVSVDGALDVIVIDDIPTMALSGVSPDVLEVEESSLKKESVPVDFSVAFKDADYGADSAASINALVYSFTVNEGVSTDLTGLAGTAITLHINNDGRVEGRVGGSSDPDDLAFVIKVDATTGEVTLTQHLPLKHPTANPEEIISMANGALSLQAEATDGDGDKASVSLNIGDRFSFKDDGPSITASPVGGTVEEAHLARGSADIKEPEKITVSSSLNVDFGADGAGNVQFTETTKITLEAKGLEANGVDLEYVIEGDGHTLTAYSGSGRTESDKVFTIVITDPQGSPGYSFTLHGAIDHLNQHGDTLKGLDIGFAGIRVTDRDGDYVETSFDITVMDDAPEATQPKLVTVDEDSELTTPGNTFNTNADATGSNTEVNGTADTDGWVKTDFGKAKVNSDGTITYVPDENYSGKDTFTYTTVTDNETKTFTVEVTVTPEADAPYLGHPDSTDPAVPDATIVTPEDTAKQLGLKLPEITDHTDRNGPVADSGDNPERLGAITLTLEGAPVGTTLSTTGFLTLTPNGAGEIIIVISSDGTNPDISLHHANMPAAAEDGVYYLTQAQYEAITANPAADRHENFEVVIKVSSYEVDDSGVPLDNSEVVGSNGAESTQTITVDVRAVTDTPELNLTALASPGGAGAVTLTVAPAVGGAPGKITAAINEDTELDLQEVLDETFKDLDGSEQFWYEVSGLPQGTVVSINGHDYMVGSAGSIEMPDTRYMTVEGTPNPSFTIKPPLNYSNASSINATITLKVLDRDGDSTEADPQVESVSVGLDLRVYAIPDDVTVADSSTNEDTAVQFLSSLALTDTDGSESITQIRITALPSEGGDWTLLDHNNTVVNIPGGGNANGGGLVLAIGGVYTLDQIRQFKLLPPGHSSLDGNITVYVTTTEAAANIQSGNPVSQEFAHNLKIKVTPVAEKVSSGTDGDTDGNNTLDLTMNGDHSYKDNGEEDEWFNLHRPGGDGVDSDDFDLKGPWKNEDTSEQTYARFTPYEADGTTKLDNSWFQYDDGSAEPVVVPFNGTPVDIPIAYLDTLQFRGPEHFKGVVRIKVEAYTVDVDEDADDNTQVTAVSGEAWLENLILHPVADQVTLNVESRVVGTEDKASRLQITPTSDDPSETFNVIISQIPVGATLNYGGQLIDEDSTGLTDISVAVSGGFYVVTINKFNSVTSLELTPPKDSNEPINLSVTAQSVDTLDLGDGTDPLVSTSASSSPLPIHITVQGVPDEPVFTTDQTKVYVENDLDNNTTNPNQVNLKDLITELGSGETASDDTSETVTLRISGLEPGFSVVGAGPVVGAATGVDRVWVVTPQQIKDDKVFIKLPENYSGTVTFTGQPVVTESDNPSETFFTPENISFKVTPTPEALLNIRSVMTEDEISKIDFSPDYKNGDTNEVISAVRFKLHADNASADVKFYDDIDGNTALVADGDGWYVATDVNSVFAKGPDNFSGDIKIQAQYKVSDPTSDDTVVPVPGGGSGSSVESEWQNIEHTLEFRPITDRVDLSLAAINGNTGETGITLTSAGTVTVALDIAKKQDTNANDKPDHDGSEHLTHILVQGVPDGVVVEGAVYTGAGQWLITLGPDNSANQFDDAIVRNIVFTVNGAAGDIANAPITITTVTRDTGAGTTEEDSITWYLTTDFDYEGPGTLPTVALEEINAPQTEDVEFALSAVVDGSIDTTGATTTEYDLTITLRTDPDDKTTFSGTGVVRTEVEEYDENGDLVPVVLWTKTVSDVTNETAQTALENALKDITVHAPDHANGNANNLGNLPLDVTVTLHANGLRSEDKVAPQVVLNPVTDNANIAIQADSVAEGEEIAIAITITNPADKDGDWSIVDGKLYLSLDGTDIPGVLSQNGTALDLESVSGVPGLTDGNYYMIPNVTPNTQLNLTYKPNGPHDKGSITLNAWVQNQEDGAAAILSDGSGVLTVKPTNTEPTLTITAQGRCFSR